MAGLAAAGTLLKMGSTPVTIAQVYDISGPSMSADTEDVTTHDSSGLPWREKVATLIDAGDVQLSLYFDPDGATHKDATGGLLDIFSSRTLEPFEIAFPDTTDVAFTAYVTQFQPKAPIDGVLTADVTLTISGALTWTYPA